MLVALIAALRGASGAGPGTRGGEDLALLAHRAETSTGAQAGVQDHVAAAVGGVLLIEVDYPQTRTRRIDVPSSALDDLRRRLLTVSFGRPHHSSDLHLRVIAALEGGDAEPFMRPLRDAAREGAAALAAGDLEAYGAAIRDNTAGQRALHPGLVGSDACRLEALVARYGPSGVVKVNGAGGEGGSATVLLPSDPEAAAAIREAVSSVQSWRVLDLHPSSDGVVVTP